MAEAKAFVGVTRVYGYGARPRKSRTVGRPTRFAGPRSMSTDDPEKVSRTDSELKCPECGEWYEQRWDDQTYCSTECASESLKDRVEKECQTCGDLFEVTRAREDTAKYCSHACSATRDDAPGRKVTLTCAYCEAEFEVLPSRSYRKYCGDECATEAKRERWTGESNPRWDGGPITVECHYCGGEFEIPRYQAGISDRHFCDITHRAAWQSERPPEEHPRYGDRDDPYGPGFNEPKREAVRERDGFVCQHPGCDVTNDDHLAEYGEQINVHHIQKATEFDKHEFRNAMENLVTLCNTHHTLWERMSPLRPTGGD